MPFVKGESGNPKGRPLGSKNRVAEDFVKAMADDFAENGPAVIAKVRMEKPGTYLKLVADLVPKDFKPDGDGPLIIQVVRYTDIEPENREPEA